MKLYWNPQRLKIVKLRLRFLNLGNKTLYRSRYKQKNFTEIFLNQIIALLIVSCEIC